MDFVIDMLSVPHAVPVNPQLGFKISEEKKVGSIDTICITQSSANGSESRPSSSNKLYMVDVGLQFFECRAKNRLEPLFTKIS